jgi:hypothetical protein
MQTYRHLNLGLVFQNIPAQNHSVNVSWILRPFCSVHIFSFIDLEKILTVTEMLSLNRTRTLFPSLMIHSVALAAESRSFFPYLHLFVYLRSYMPLPLCLNSLHLIILCFSTLPFLPHRYFVLQGKTISYYADERDNRPRRTIDLSHCIVRNEGTKKGGMYHIICIYLASEVMLDLGSWIEISDLNNYQFAS